MNTTEMALLSTNPAVNRWFQLKYPEVEIYETVSEDFRNKEIIFILPTYRIANEYYEIQQMWTYYMSRLRYSHKLVTIGWEPFDIHPAYPNYLQITDPPKNWLKWIEELAPVRSQYLNQPELVDENILVPIEKMLKSHGKNTFQSLMTGTGIQQPLVKLEEILQKESILSLRYTEEYISAKSFLVRLETLWQQAYPYFALMPNFPELQGYIQWEASMNQLLSTGKWTDLPLSRRTGDFLDEVLTAITDFYDLT